MLLLDQQIKPLLLWIRTAIIKDIEMKYAEYTKDVQRLANTFKTELLIVTVTLTFIFWEEKCYKVGHSKTCTNN